MSQKTTVGPKKTPMSFLKRASSEYSCRIFVSDLLEFAINIYTILLRRRGPTRASCAVAVRYRTVSVHWRTWLIPNRSTPRRRRCRPYRRPSRVWATAPPTSTSQEPKTAADGQSVETVCGTADKQPPDSALAWTRRNEATRQEGAAHEAIRYTQTRTQIPSWTSA
jgi:hypothetical protein